MTSRPMTLGVDLGGTGIKLGLVDAQGKLGPTTRFATPKGDPRAVVDLIANHALALIGGKSKRIKAIGIGAAGDIDPEKGIIRISPNLGWRNVPFKTLLTKKLPYPIVLDNDANAAAWGAYVVEAKKKIPNLLCVMLGTGVGGGIIINGRLYKGATGTAGEIGHMTLYPEGIPCACGNQGCLERYIGAKDLAKAVRREIESGQTTLMTEMVHGNLEALTPLIMTQAARKGDALARRLYEEAGERLGIGLASVVNFMNPDWIVLAGGISRAGSLILNPVRRTLLKRSFPTPAKAVKLFISKKDQDLGILGAGLLAHDF
jgi:glucokinase